MATSSQLQSNYSFDRRIEMALRFGGLALFLGWGLIHLIWEVPYRALLWNEEIMSGPVQAMFGLSWPEYASSERIEVLTQSSIHAVGVLLLVCAGVCLLPKVYQKAANLMLLLGSLILLGVASMYYIESHYQMAMLLEHSAQFTLPVVISALVFRSYSQSSNLLLFFVKVATALTFFCHGLYAIGYYPVPGNFIDMTIAILGASEAQSRTFLMAAGVIDIAVAFAVFFPGFDRWAFMYAVVWGALTAVARPVSGIEVTTGLSEILYWVLQFLYRVPHSVVPLLGFWLTSVQPFGKVQQRDRSRELIWDIHRSSSEGRVEI